MKSDILGLFNQAYGSEMLPPLWDWAYIQNPCGHPIVAIEEENRKVCAHYAVIPVTYSNKNGRKLKAALSMTTMVAPSHQGKGLFTTLAKAVYQELISQSYDVVLGFPNSQSKPGFQRKLHWNIPEVDFVATVPGAELKKAMIFREMLKDTDAFTLNIGDPEVWDWRFSKPGSTYQTMFGHFAKKQNLDIGQDIVYLDVEALDSLDEEVEYTVLVPHDEVSLLPYLDFSYQFGWRDFRRESSTLMFSRFLAMSDVF